MNDIPVLPWWMLQVARSIEQEYGNNGINGKEKQSSATAYQLRERKGGKHPPSTHGG